MKVLWIGYGKMGEPMCGRVGEAGHSVTVFDTGAPQRDAATKRGFPLTDSPNSIAEEADAIIASLPNDAACMDVLASPAGVLAHARAGAVLIETSTISVAASRAIAKAAAARGVAYLRAPVSGTVGAAASGGLSSFVSGPEDAIAKATPLVQCWAKKLIPVGSEEQARTMKLAVNLMVDTLIVSLSEAFAFCKKGGVDPAVAIDGICGSAIASPHLAFKAQSLLREDFVPTFTVTQTRKDLKLISEEARDLGVPVLLGAAVEQIMAATEGAGFGQDDYVACGKLIQRLSGL
jgi:3-hydroxyisobutyrate dehydrogenase-like beta-hydroxyacid dehydrogenase